MNDLMLAITVLGILLAATCAVTAIILWLALAPAPIKHHDPEGTDQ